MQERKGGTDGLRLDAEAGAIADLGGYAAIVPGSRRERVVERITSTDADERMPPQGDGQAAHAARDRAADAMDQAGARSTLGIGRM